MSSIAPNTALYIRNLNDKIKKEGSSTLLRRPTCSAKRSTLDFRWWGVIGLECYRTAQATVQPLHALWQSHFGHRDERAEDEGPGVRGV